jgi:hypothetical protein
MADYRTLANRGKSIAELLAMPPGGEDIELELPDRKELARVADLS